MLKFIIGTAGSGKSARIMNEITELAKQGRKSILIVPEQFSKTGETHLFSLLDRENAQRSLVQLHSFTSLKTEIQNNYGSFTPKVLTRAGKAVMARRAIKANENVLKLYKRQAESFSFTYTLRGTFDDLERSGFAPKDLSCMIADSDRQLEKLNEISLLYSEYRGLMGDRFCDEEDVLKIIAEKLPREYTDGENIFIDGFEHFSYGQKLIIKTMTERADSVTVSLVCDGINSPKSETDTFFYTRQTARSLIKYADGKVNGLPLMMTSSPRFLSHSLKLADDYIIDGETGEKCADDEENLYVTGYPAQAEEVCACVAEIRKLIKENGYTYNDIAIVAPQLEKYEHQLQESLTLAGMPYFIDEGRIIQTSQAVVFFAAIMKTMSEGLTPENAVMLLHTGLTEISDEDIRLFDSYLFIWADANLDFATPFTLSTEGIKRNPDDDEKDDLAAINSVRAFLYEKFSGLTGNEIKTGTDIMKTVWETAQSLGAEDRIREIARGITDDDEKALCIRLWDVAVDCINTLSEILTDDALTADAVYELYEILVSGTKLEFSPQTQDCIMISQPKRMKLDSVRAVFILGAAEESFPAVTASVGLITDSDREALGLRLDSDFRNQASFENLYYYKAMTTAREKLFISFCENNIGEKQDISESVNALRTALNVPQLKLKIQDYALNPDFLRDYVSCVSNADEKEKYISLLKKAGIDVSGYTQRDYTITHTEKLRGLLTRRGDRRMWISPSRAENYFECPFMYFLDGVLKIRPLEKARFDFRISGTYLHYIVEKVIRKYGEDFYRQTEAQIDADVDEAVAQYLEETFPPEIRNNVKFVSQYDNMRENARELLHYILDEQKHGRFRPVEFEKKIGIDNIPPLRITTEEGNEVAIHGIIDRVDILRGEDRDWLRIVDYKTGSKEFKENDIASGLSSQLLVYMNGLLRADYAKGDRPVSAGAVMYQHAEARPKKDDDTAALFDAVGMAVQNDEIAKAFGNILGNQYGVIYETLKGGIKSAGGSIVTSEENFDRVLKYVNGKISEMGDASFRGDFAAVPLAEKPDLPGKMCAYCNYSAVCMRAMMTTGTRLKEDKSKIYADKEDDE